jgi:hypothetical protein
MSDAVTILGLAADFVDPESIQGTAVWSLNDWYQFYPGVIPSRVFNIHYAPHVNKDPRRFTGDWKAHYNEICDDSGVIMVSERIEGVREDRQRIVPILAMTRAGWPLVNMPCSISLMIQFAGFLGKTYINLQGVHLYDGEYRSQIRAIRAAIDLCRKRGIVVNNPCEEEWKAREEETPDWAKGQDVAVGSSPHILAMHMTQLAGDLRLPDLCSAWHISTLLASQLPGKAMEEVSHAVEQLRAVSGGLKEMARVANVQSR